MSQGVIFMLISSLISAFSAVFAKVILEDMSLVELALFRNLIGIFIVSYFIYKKPLRFKKGGKPYLLASRAILGILGMFTYFYIIATVPLGVAITLNKTSPIFGALFSFIFLKERLNKYALGALFIGFIGVVFIANPTSDIEFFDIFIGIISGVVAALAYTSIRAIKDSYDTREIVLAFASAGFLLSLFLLFVEPYIFLADEYKFVLDKFIMPDSLMWIFIVALGFSGTAAQYFMTKAYECEKTGIVGTIAYANIPFAIFFGVLLGDKSPTLMILIGITLVVFSGFLVGKKDKNNS